MIKRTTKKEDDSNVKNIDDLLNIYPLEINFVIQKAKEELIYFNHTDILTEQEEVRKHKINVKEYFESQEQKMLNVSNLQFVFCDIDNTVKLK